MESIKVIENKLGDDKMNSLDDIAKKVKRLTYDLETVRRLVENTTDIDRVRDDLDATIHKVRQLELAYQN